MSSQLWQVTVRNHQLRLDLTISHRGHHYSPDITNEIITRLVRGYVELIDFHETAVNSKTACYFPGPMCPISVMWGTPSWAGR